MSDFSGACVLSFESRRAQETSTMISKFKGVPLVAPSLKEIPLSDNPQAFDFAQKLLDGQIDAVIFTTGVGTNYFFEAIKTRFSLEDVFAKLNNTYIVARGPKPVKALNEHKIKIDLKIPEPNTWREIIRELERPENNFTCADKEIGIQEYGTSNKELIEALTSRGAVVTSFPVYRWSLPDDTTPLRNAVRAVIGGKVDILLLTSAVQIRHALEVAAQENLSGPFSEALKKIVICSIGPVSSAALAELGFQVDFEPSHPKLGTLISETAQNAQRLLKENGRG